MWQIAMPPRFSPLCHAIELRLRMPVDPLTRLMMDADGVSASEMEVLMRRACQALAIRSGRCGSVPSSPPQIPCPSVVSPIIRHKQS